MSLLEVLIDEHRGFAPMLAVLDSAAERVRRGKHVDPDMLGGLIDFFERFTDGHHLQEEKMLFPLLAQHGLGRDLTVVNALLAQHEAGRAYTGKMRADLGRIQAGDPEAREHFAGLAHGYVELIREHIRIEDSYFYGVAEEVLTHVEKERITEAFDRARGQRVPESERERYLAMLREFPAEAARWASEA